MLLGGSANPATTKDAPLSSHMLWGDKVVGSRSGDWGNVQAWVGSQDKAWF